MGRGRPVLVAAAIVALGPAALADTTPPRSLAPSQPYTQQREQLDEEPTCLAVTIERNRRGASILLRNKCALRVNWALCVRRSDDAKPLMAKGSLSPAAVDEELVPFTSKTKTFTHAETFCSGLLCDVATPEC